LTLTLKPIGRGNWRVITMTVTGTRAQPLLVRVGEVLLFGGMSLRICEVKA